MKIFNTPDNFNSKLSDSAALTLLVVSFWHGVLIIGPAKLLQSDLISWHHAVLVLFEFIASGLAISGGSMRDALWLISNQRACIIIGNTMLVFSIVNSYFA